MAEVNMTSLNSKNLHIAPWGEGTEWIITCNPGFLCVWTTWFAAPGSKQTEADCPPSCQQSKLDRLPDRWWEAAAATLNWQAVMQYFPLDIGLRKAAACVHPQDIRFSFILAGEGSRLAQFSCVCEQEFGFSALLHNLIFTVLLGQFLLFILEKLSFFIAYWLKSTWELRQKSTTEVNFITTKCFMTSPYLIL